MLYDTHAHVNFAGFKENYKEIIKKSLAAGIWLNNVGSQKDTSAESVRIAEEFGKGVYAVVGLHPVHTLKQKLDEEESHFLTREEKFDYAYYRSLAQSPKVVGIGECGLDYYRLPEGQSLEEVKAVEIPAFLEQIRLAKDLNKALVIHCRATKNSYDAYEDILEILRAKKAANELPSFEIHSFTANWEICQKFLELGGYIGLNGIITFDKTGLLDEVIRNCPLDKIILETDSPYLAPVPFRGQKNQPLYLGYVAAYLAKARNFNSLKEIGDITASNARQLFGVA